MALFFHGTSAEPFDRFDLSHVLEGDGKVKFGYGIYLTSRFETAAHYSFKEGARVNYVYTVQTAALTEDNSIGFKEKVSMPLVDRLEDFIREPIPQEAIKDGGSLRKYLAKRLLELGSSSKVKCARTTLLGEQRASELLSKVGIVALTWPVNWVNPSSGLNCAILNPEDAVIVKIESVMLDSKRHFIKGSNCIIREF